MKGEYLEGIYQAEIGITATTIELYSITYFSVWYHMM